jgi:preprotein translocase subunit SecD
VRRKGVAPLILFVVVTIAAVAYTLAAGNSPLLGLDLQGGVSVVLQPDGEIEDASVLDQAVEVIRKRVDGLGVAEPEITRQGSTVLIQLPGVDNQQRALDLVGQTAELRFRPVLQILPPVDVATAPTTTGAPGTTTEGGVGATTTTGGAGGATTTAPTTTAPTAGGDEQGLGLLTEGESAAGLQATTTAPPTTVPPTTVSPTTVPATGDTLPPDVSIPPTADTSLPRNLNDEGLTPRALDIATRRVVLAERDEDGVISVRYLLGPTALTGSALDGAEASIDSQDPTASRWIVSPRFKSGGEGIDQFNELATSCYNATAECPSQDGVSKGLAAIVLDGEVVSAPEIQQPEFGRSDIQISGSFDEDSAKDLALVLRYGALPVELEPQQVRTVSATLGEDSLQAGVIAGVIGLILTALLMVGYYRLLGVVAIASLTLEFLLVWAIIAWLGETQGLALTLAGVVGLIVSIGISVDSNVVFYEHLKEDVHNGRTFRSTVERSFDSSFATIIKADIASLIGAFLLYWLSVGPVRGFALLLGLSTVIDIIASWFFIRPSVLLLARNRRLRERPEVFGMPKVQDAPEALTT